ncbi:DsbA family protein [Halomarina ordinaria]|uniref:DsbA family protein n=1 Tax=Halomarina ordinaria TaxID=3033939 RepID=A0ABD5U783_9EURY|nr:thioredoxin domain-containing protein [Halomarina sp. PSRA2]
MTLSRRRFLAAAGATGAVGLAGCLGSSEEMPDGPVTQVSVPDSPGDYTYATMGTGEEPLVTYIGNWKCPFCAAFSENYLRDIVSNYVEPGDLSLEYRDWPGLISEDDVNAVHAGLAVWEVDPETYWTYHEYVMVNQPSESESWTTADRLAGFAESAGVSDPDAVRQAVEEEAYQEEVQANQQYVQETGAGGTPAMVIDGSSYQAIGDREGNANPDVEEALTALVEE